MRQKREVKVINISFLQWMSELLFQIDMQNWLLKIV